MGGRGRKTGGWVRHGGYIEATSIFPECVRMWNFLHHQGAPPRPAAQVGSGAGPKNRVDTATVAQKPARRLRDGGTAPRGTGQAVATHCRGKADWQWPMSREWRCGPPGRRPANGHGGACRKELLGECKPPL